MLETLIDLDTQCFYWINQHHSPICDWVMWLASAKWTQAVIIGVLFAYLCTQQQRRRSIVLLLGIGLCFLLSDRISVVCFKDVVCRLRPCHALADVRMFRTQCGGLYGFVSSHAANIFALVLYLVLYHNKLTRPKRHRCNTVVFGIALFAWALLIGYSRPYLGKHYPGDVLCGAIVGLAIGGLVYLASRWAIRRWSQWFEGFPNRQETQTNNPTNND